MYRTRLPALSALLVCAISLPAMAFTTGDTHQGASPDRLQSFDATVQAELRSRPAWRDFLAGEGAGWTVRFDEATGAPLTLLGGGVPIDTSSPAAVERGLRAFLGRHADLLHAPPKAMQAARASYSGDLDTWYVDIPVEFEGLAVVGGRITARIKHGQLVMLGVTSYDGVPRVGEALLDASEAEQTAIDLGPAAGATHADLTSEAIWLPRVVDSELLLVRTWKVTSTTQEPIGRWVSYIDAETGELLNVHNEVLFFDGQILGRHNPRRGTDPLIDRPLRDLRIQADGGARVFTDVEGLFSVEGSSATAFVRGTDLTVIDSSDGSVSSVTVAGNPFVMTAGSGITQAEINSYVAIEDVQEWGLRFAPEVTVGDGRGGVLVSRVNRTDGNCNAFYDGQSVNFYAEARGCSNTGLLADVNYHEWGHGFHANSIRSGEFNGSLSEGAADAVAFLQTDDNVLAPGFFTNSTSRGIRDAEPNRVYPADVTGEVHSDGLIFAGALWDLVRELEGTMSRDAARDVVSGLLAGALKAGPTLATVGEEILVADDDDGNLSNGTPHFCSIVTALGAHGLVPASALSAVVVHEQRIDGPADAPIALVAEAPAQSVECIDLSSVDFVYRNNGGAWSRATARRAEADLTADLPAQPFGTFVEYYLDAGGVQIPTGGPIAPLSMYVGGVLPVDCEGFEVDDGGYTHELISGQDRLGADDWQWGTPNGLSGDPARAASGFNIWGNDLGGTVDGQQWNGAYQGEKHTRLTSPVLTFPEHLEGVFLRYQRWLNVEDGAFDKAHVLADGQIVWANYDSGTEAGGSHHQEDRWVTSSVDLGDATADGQVQLAWETISDGGLEFGGWNLDQVCLVAPASPNNRLAILDFQAEDSGQGGVTLTWTNPGWAPLAEVVVVRKKDSAPTGPTDGDVVFRDDAPELSAAVQAFDDTGKSGDEYFYAVYGGDGTDWLGWTVQGRNLDLGSGVGQPKGGLIASGGCSCDTGSSTGGLAWLGLVGLVLGLRRRRQRPTA